MMMVCFGHGRLTAIARVIVMFCPGGSVNRRCLGRWMFSVGRWAFLSFILGLWCRCLRKQ